MKSSTKAPYPNLADLSSATSAVDVEIADVDDISFSGRRLADSVEHFEPLGGMPEQVDGDDPAKWNTKRVGEWLQAVGLAKHAPAFRSGRITGDVMSLLHEDHLKELGVAVVGERVALLRAIGKFRKRAVNRERFRTIWEADAIIHDDGPRGWCRNQCCCVPCCEDPDHYKLTGSTLILVQQDRHKLKGGCSGFCATSKETRNIDLSSIAGVTALHSSTCCDCGCEADQILVQLNNELGLEPPEAIKIAKGDGDRVLQLIQAAVEEAQVMGSAPSNQAMHR